jgi:hypothetical protein
MPTRKERDDAKRNQRKWDQAFTLFGLALALGEWGYSVISPNPNLILGSVLLGAAFLCVGIGTIKVFELRSGSATLLCISIVVIFGLFDWYVVVEPERGQPFKQLLVAGYHLTDDCSTRSAAEPLPEWIKTQSTAWQARVEQLITQKLDYKEIQAWRGAVILGRVSDANMTAYQCNLLSIKVEALEAIIADNYDPKLAHQKYDGPLYWLESVDGKVDISEALKNGGARFTIHKGGDGTQITGTVPPKQP